LASAVFTFAVYGYIGLELYRMIGSDLPGEATFMVLAVFWPKCLLGFIFGSYLVGFVIYRWRGDVNRMLLLRLLDAEQKRST
jgi:hypothetical protein